MKKISFPLKKFSLIVCMGIFLIIPAVREVRATTKAYLVTPGFYWYENQPTTGYIFFYNHITIDNYQPGSVILSKHPDGTGDMNVGDAIQAVGIYPASGAFTYQTDCVNYNPILKPTDITQSVHLAPDTVNNILVRFAHWCYVPKNISPVYLVHTFADEKDTARFLDLPWDYKSKGLNFTDAALTISSYFDHEYPLLSSTLKEPESANNSIIMFDSKNRLDRAYSSHDGYDYAGLAQVHFGDAVLAASDGWAWYDNSCAPCGNMMLIDHENGYQTRYLHLQKEGLLTSITDAKIQVVQGQQIGKIGATGNVSPTGNQGAHIHFMVIQDKNNDGNFEDNIPDGVTDPFGWSPNEPDPWEQYEFYYNNELRTGNKSIYLWKHDLVGLDKTITPAGDTFQMSNYTVNFPEGFIEANLVFTARPAPPPTTQNSGLNPVGIGIDMIIKDFLDNLITTFSDSFTLAVDLTDLDLSNINENTLSFYSTNDGVNWNKEITSVDIVNQKATLSVNHLTTFTLMGEAKDRVTPSTTLSLQGDEGEPLWFRSDVQFSLEAQDNTDGLGIDYTLYKVNEQEWETYTSPLTFSDEGDYHIQFYTADKGGNIETVQEKSFTIDKTPPEAVIYFDDAIHDIITYGKDSSKTSVNTVSNATTITDQAGNIITFTSQKTNSPIEKKLTVHSFGYNHIPIGTNEIHTLKINKNQPQRLRQEYMKNQSLLVTLIYHARKDETMIIEGHTKKTIAGSAILQLTTDKGEITYAY